MWNSVVDYISWGAKVKEENFILKICVQDLDMIFFKLVFSVLFKATRLGPVNLLNLHLLTLGLMLLIWK